MAVKNIKGGRGRFDGCATLEDIKARMRSTETIGLYTYGGGKQFEVRTIRNGRRIIVATAEVNE